MPSASQIQRAKSLPIREIGARVFVVTGSQYYLVTIRTMPIADDVQPAWWSCFGPDGPCENSVHREDPCAHVYAAVLQIQKEQEAANA